MSESLTELRVAEGIANGILESPTDFFGSVYFDLRISGTGIAWRSSIKEYVWRDPALWLSPAMQRRALGLPVIVEHPPSGLLTSQSFAERCIGIIVDSYIDEANRNLRGIARIIDANAAEMLRQGAYDTSPSIRLPRSTPTYIEHDGAKLLIEGTPSLLDHLAICELGVWTRSGEPGVKVETQSEEGIEA